jgi:hypothetical protein
MLGHPHIGVQRFAYAAPLPRLEYDSHLDQRIERKACDHVQQAARALLFSEDPLQQLRQVARGSLNAAFSMPPFVITGTAALTQATGRFAR